MSTALQIKSLSDWAHPPIFLVEVKATTSLFLGPKTILPYYCKQLCISTLGLKTPT